MMPHCADGLVVWGLWEMVHILTKTCNTLYLHLTLLLGRVFLSANVVLRNMWQTIHRQPHDSYYGTHPASSRNTHQRKITVSPNSPTIPVCWPPARNFQRKWSPSKWCTNKHMIMFLLSKFNNKVKTWRKRNSRRAINCEHASSFICLHKLIRFPAVRAQSFACIMWWVSQSCAESLWPLYHKVPIWLRPSCTAINVHMLLRLPNHINFTWRMRSSISVTYSRHAAHFSITRSFARFRKIPRYFSAVSNEPSEAKPSQPAGAKLLVTINGLNTPFAQCRSAQSATRQPLSWLSEALYTSRVCHTCTGWELCRVRAQQVQPAS